MVASLYKVKYYNTLHLKPLIDAIKEKMFMVKQYAVCNYSQCDPSSHKFPATEPATSQYVELDEDDNPIMERRESTESEKSHPASDKSPFRSVLHSLNTGRGRQPLP